MLLIWIKRQKTQRTGLSFFRFLGFLLGLGQGQRLLESMAHFIEFSVVQVMNALAALGIEVDQFFIVAHGCARSDGK